MIIKIVKIVTKAKEKHKIVNVFVRNRFKNYVYDQHLIIKVHNIFIILKRSRFNTICILIFIIKTVWL